MEFRTRKETSARPSIRSELDTLKKEMKITQLSEKTKREKKFFKFPFKWNAKMRKSLRDKNKILVFYMNIKNDIEPPRLLPIEDGNMVIVKGKPYEVDPRAFWRMGKYKCLFIKEIDRRPVSNLDYSEIRARGDSTDSDEFLIKAAMKAIQVPGKKPMAKGMVVIAVLVLVGIVVFMFIQGGATPPVA